MNYLNKYNSIGDVDMIHILERLDAGVLAEDIIAELPTNNHIEARGLLDTITFLEAVRSTIVPPKETLHAILQNLDASLKTVVSEDRRVSVNEVISSLPVAARNIPSSFFLQKYFFPVSVIAAVSLLVVGGSFFTKSPIGSDAVLYELGREDPSDVFPDDGLLQISDETAQPPSSPAPDAHFNALVGEEKKDTQQVGEATPSSEESPKSAKSTSIESMQSPEQLSSTRPASLLYSDTLETTIVPLIQNEQLDAYGVFPEDGFSMYLHTLTDLPIDNF